MSKTVNAGGMTMVIERSFRGRDSYGRTLRSVHFCMPNVAPPGADWTAAHGGRHFELTSFNDGAVEVYVRNSDGIYMHEGSVLDYFPGGEDAHNAFRAVWTAEQPSAAAKKAFEASATKKSHEIYASV